eukprot:scaffold82480_cov61-Phaeocystis_antarctica.AAC.4
MAALKQWPISPSERDAREGDDGGAGPRRGQQPLHAEGLRAACRRPLRRLKEQHRLLAAVAHAERGVAERVAEAHHAGGVAERHDAEAVGDGQAAEQEEHPADEDERRPPAEQGEALRRERAQRRVVGRVAVEGELRGAEADGAVPQQQEREQQCEARGAVRPAEAEPAPAQAGARRGGVSDDEHDDAQEREQRRAAEQELGRAAVVGHPPGGAEAAPLAAVVRDAAELEAERGVREEEQAEHVAEQEEEDHCEVAEQQREEEGGQRQHGEAHGAREADERLVAPPARRRLQKVDGRVGGDGAREQGEQRRVVQHQGAQHDGEERAVARRRRRHVGARQQLPVAVRHAGGEGGGVHEHLRAEVGAVDAVGSAEEAPGRRLARQLHDARHRRVGRESEGGVSAG